MIDVKRIKTDILTLAFQGKLLSRSHAFGINQALHDLHCSINRFQPVEVCERLIETPAHWTWTRLGYVTSNHGQIKPTASFSYIDVGTLDNIHQRLSQNENIIEAENAPSRARKIVRHGDVLYSTVRPYLHNICIVDKSFKAIPIASTAFCVMCVNEEILLNKYLFYWLLTSEFDKYANGNPSTGTLYPAIGEKALLNGVIPLPCLDEQMAIVEKIEAAFAAIEQLQDSLLAFNRDLDTLRHRVIGAGLRGNLTERLPEDGDADALIEQIASKRLELVKQKRMRKGKTLPPIDAIDIPFSIPENWKWVRTGDIFDVGTGVTPSTSETKYYEGGTIPWIGSTLTAARYITAPEKYVTEYAMEETSLRLYPAHTLIIALYGEGKTRGQIAELLIPATTNQACAALNNIIYHQAMVDYVYYVYTYNYDALRQKASGTNQSNLNLQKIKETLIPLPPLAEQQRIVSRLRELLDELPA